MNHVSEFLSVIFLAIFICNFIFASSRRTFYKTYLRTQSRVSVQGVKSLGDHFACLCPGFEFYEVKKKLSLFFKKKMEILLHF